MELTKKFITAVIFAAVTFASQAGATEVQTTSYSSWLATVNGLATEWDFSFSSSSFNTASGYNLNAGAFGPINVTGPDGGGYVLNKTSYGTSNYIALAGPGDGVGTMNFTAPSAGLTAFGLGVGISGTAAPVQVTLSDGEAFTLNPALGGTVFLGLSSATPINSFVLSTASGATVDLTDFFAATSGEPGGQAPAPAAEVATALMIGTGLLFIGAKRKVFSNLSHTFGLKARVPVSA